MTHVAHTIASDVPRALDAPAIEAAEPGHVERIFVLIEEASRSSTVLPRTRESIADNLGDFLVARDGPELLACGALHQWTPGLAEIKSLVTADKARGRGIGSSLVRALVDLAARREMNRLFVLADNAEFFTRFGFGPTDRATLPHKVWNECLLCSKFFDCTEVALDRTLAPKEAPA